MAAQLEHRRERLAAGERPAGWKIGLNLPAVQERLGISAPVIGFLTSGGRLEPGADHSLAGGTNVSVEAEIAIHVGADVPAGADPATASAAIAALSPALELVDIDMPLDDLEAILARNVFHRAFVLGAADEGRAGGRHAGIPVTVSSNGKPRESATASEALPDLGAMVRVVADLLAASGEALRAGDVIISGALTPNVWPAAGDRIEADFGPLGSLSLSFTAA